MTTLEAIQTIGNFKLGGVFTDESTANTQQILLNLLNMSRQKVLRDFYIATKRIAQVNYQSFDVIASWEDKCSFTAQIPTIMTFPPPQMNGWDGLFPICQDALGLTEIESEQQLRGYRSGRLTSQFRTSGWYITTGQFLTGYLKPMVKADGLTARAVLSRPQDAPGFNIEKDPYPFPDDMFSEVKRILEGDDGRRWMTLRSDQISNSQVDSDAAGSANR